MSGTSGLNLSGPYENKGHLLKNLFLHPKQIISNLTSPYLINLASPAGALFPTPALSHITPALTPGTFFCFNELEDDFLKNYQNLAKRNSKKKTM